MIRKIDIENWNTTKKLRKVPPLNPADNLPFKTSTGRKAERKNAGYAPANTPTTKTMITKDGSNQVKVCKFIIRSFPEIWLNTGSSVHAANRAIVVAVNVMIKDSERNCTIRYLRGEPNTFRTPTSRARLAERAVDRFMKLMHANSNMNMAIKEKI